MQRKQFLHLLTGSCALPLINYGQPPMIQAPRRIMRIAHLTDIHLHSLPIASKGLEKCFHHLQNLTIKPDLIINGGDTIMEGHQKTQDKAKLQWELWQKIVKSENNLPIINCVGNHDIWCKEETKMCFDAGKQWAMDELQMNHRYQSFDKNGWHIVVLDSIQSKSDGSWYTGCLDEEQFDWLEKDLKSVSTSTPILVVSHIPILTACVFFDGKNINDGNWQISGSWMHTDALKITELFYKFPNIKLALSGHIHLADQVVYNKVTYCCNGAVCGAWWFGNYRQTTPGYALIDLFDDGSFTNNYINYLI